MIEKAKEKLTGHEEQPTKPLIRLRLLYDEEEQMFNAIRFGQQFNTLVLYYLFIKRFSQFIFKFYDDIFRMLFVDCQSD